MTQSRPGHPTGRDGVGWGLVGYTMITLIVVVVRLPANPIAWVMALTFVPTGCWLAWRRWRNVRDRVPHI